MVKADRQAGLTLIEVVCATGVLVLVSLGSMMQLLTSQTLTQDTELRRVALEAAENEIERIHALPFDEVASQGGRTFTVAGLGSRASGADHGAVAVFVDPDDADNPALPTSPVNANGDLGTAAKDILTACLHRPDDATDTRAVPVVVTVTYPSRSGGEATVRITTVITPSTFFNE